MAEGPRKLRDDERVDDAMRAAFQAPSGSALEAIERLCGSRYRVLLRDAPEDASPVLRVAKPEEESALAADGRYQVVGEIGRGGMGTVYKGRDRDLGRDVALKVLRGDLAGQQAVVQRFVEEAQVGGQLQHPGIVPIYGMGLQRDGRPYFAMKLIKGETLASLLQGGSHASGVIGVFLRVAQTVAYAHSRGVIHRDLKPSNVMVGAFGEVHVVDWGFAKVLGREESPGRPDATIVSTVRTGAEGSQSVAGSVMGTPAYMPPEQALGQIEQLTERSDVFALGAILCEILTRQPPYLGTLQDQLLAAAQARLDGAQERIEACNAPDALKRLARDCLQPLPMDRPKDAGEVAARLADHLASVEERARQAELDRVHAAAESRRVQRSRRTAMVLAAVVLVAIVGGAGGLHAWTDAERVRAEAAAAKVAPLLREATRLEGEKDWPRARAAANTALAMAQTEGADPDTLATARAQFARVSAAAEAAAALEEKTRSEARLIEGLDEATVLAAGLDVPQGEAGFAQPFAEFGVDPDDERAAQALSGFSRSAELALHLDTWAGYRRLRGDERWKTLDRLARALDDDSWRTRLRDAARAKDAAAVSDLAASADIANAEPGELCMLARALVGVGKPEAAESLLRQANPRHRGDFWIHQILGDILWWRLRRARDALVHVQAAVALRPRSASTWNTLGAIRNDGLEDYDGALRAFRNAIEINPRWAGFHGNVARALTGKGDFDGAIAKYREAIRVDPTMVEVYEGLGALLCDHRHEYDEAIAVFREALALDPGNVPVCAGLYVALKAKGDIDGANEALRLTANDAKVKADLARALWERGDRSAAFAAQREAVRLAPEDASTHFDLGKMLYETEDFDGAIAAYGEAARLDGKKARARAYLGDAWRRKGDLNRAIREYRVAVGLDTQDAEPALLLAQALRESGDVDGAIAMYREVIRRKPDWAMVHSTLGQLLDDRGDREGALAALREAIRIDPNDAQSWCNLGIALRTRGDLRGSIEAQRKALQLDPTHARASCNLGIALEATGDLDGALAAHREAIRLDPGLAPAHCNLGIVLWAKGDVDGALAAQRAALRVDPNLVPAHTLLGDALERKGDVTGAIASYRNATRIEPKNPRTWCRFGALLRRIGDIEGGIAAHREAVRLAPRWAVAHHDLGLALLESGDLDGSLAAIRKACELAPASLPTARTLAAVERMAATAARLPAVMKGEDRPQNPGEWRALAEFAYHIKSYPASVHCWREAFAADQRLAEQPGCRYDAACAASRAGADAHAQALAWLRAELAAVRAQPAAQVARALYHWKSDPDLAAVRDGNLPEEWRGLWADVDALLAKMEEASK